MSVEITTAMVEQYGANVQLLSQQKDSRLEKAVRIENGIVGENAFFDQIGQAAAKKRTTRHADTPRMDTPHARRRVSLEPYDYADLLDKPDKVRTLIDPVNGYARAAAAAMNRAKDDVIITAAVGTSYTGQKGSTAVSLPSSQKVVHASAGLTLAKLIDAKALFGENDVDEDIPLHIAVAQKQITNLLNDSTLTSADYNTVKLLVKGEINTFMGFEFHRSQRLGTDSDGNRQVMAWAEDGILLAIGMNVEVDIGPRRDKNNSIQVFYSMDIGATRMEEKKVVEVACVEA